MVRNFCNVKRIIFFYMIFIIFIFNFNFSFAFTVDFFKDENSDETLSFEYVDRKSGLSNLSVSSIIQDKNGFLWFGTQGGLNFYDGRQVDVIRNNPFDDNGLLHNLIQTMYYDETKNEIWIGTYQGLSHFVIDENKFENYTVEKNGLSNSVVVSILKDIEGYIWIGTMDGLNRLNETTGEIKKYDIPKNVVRDLKIDSKGNFWIGTYDGLYLYDYSKDRIYDSEVELASDYVMVIEEFHEGILTLGLWDGGLSTIDLSDMSVSNEEFLDNRVYCITETNDGTIWIGTWGGGLFVESKDGYKYHFDGIDSGSGLSHPIVYSLYQDDSDILWIGTNGGGISKINPRKHNYLKYYHDAENDLSLGSGKINKIFQDSLGRLWIAIYNNGLNLYDEPSEGFKKYFHDENDEYSLPDNQITDILSLNNGNFLVSSFGGISEYDIVKDEFHSLNILPDDTLAYALESIDSDELLIGTYRKGLYRYNKLTGNIINYRYVDENDYTISDNLIYDILYDSKGRIWVATNNGLNLMEKGETSFKIYNRIDGDYTKPASKTMRVIFEDSKGRIWVGMVGGGIARYNDEDESFKSYTEKDGMSSNEVMAILEDDKGRIWCSTHGGISILNPETEEIYFLNPEDGIGGLEFNTGHLKDDEGNLLFGGIHGITEIPNDFLENHSHPPRLYITDIEVYQKSIDERKLFFNDETFEFDYNDSFLGFKFTAIDYDAPEKLTFSYKLEGFDKDWITSGNRDYVSYSNLKPGEYELKVRAKSVRNVESGVESVYFKIKSPWYGSKVAYIIYVLLVVLILRGGIRIKEAQLINERNSQLAEINDKLELANEELEKLSIKDSLTGLYNRRYFDIIMDEQLNLSKRSKVEFSLIMLDVDDFKYINDGFGHIAGDYLLEDIGKVIYNSLPRNTDSVARYGGDEFAIVLYDTDEQGALIVANRIKGEVEKVRVRKEFVSGEKGVTVSMGLVSLVPDQNITVKMVIQAADKGLYSAKNKGKNQICVNYIENNI